MIIHVRTGPAFKLESLLAEDLISVLSGAPANSRITLYDLGPGVGAVRPSSSDPGVIDLLGGDVGMSAKALISELQARSSPGATISLRRLRAAPLRMILVEEPLFEDPLFVLSSRSDMPEGQHHVIDYRTQIPPAATPKQAYLSALHARWI